jgi:hypothetical protein
VLGLYRHSVEIILVEFLLDLTSTCVWARYRQTNRRHRTVSAQRKDTHEPSQRARTPRYLLVLQSLWCSPASSFVTLSQLW